MGEYAYVEIVKGIYGLPQAGKLAQDKLVKHLATHGYYPTANTPCLFRHESRPIAFTLVVDDFGIKCNGDEHAEHLFAALREEYTITVDYTGSKYVGITIQHDKAARTMSLSMPGYVLKALTRFEVPTQTHATSSPLLYTPPSYGKRSQQWNTVDLSAQLSPTEAKFIQKVVGVFGFYTAAVDPTMLTAVRKAGSAQAEPTQAVMSAANRLLQYAATWPDATIVYRPSDMRLYVHSDASYLSETEARSRAGGLFYLGNNSMTCDLVVNGAIDCLSCIIPTVVASAMEAEYAAMYLNGQHAEGMRNTLEDLGYPQPSTIMISDNMCAIGLVSNTMKQRRSKAIDMRYHWISSAV